MKSHDCEVRLDRMRIWSRIRRRIGGGYAVFSLRVLYASVEGWMEGKRGRGREATKQNTNDDDE